MTKTEATKLYPTVPRSAENAGVLNMVADAMKADGGSCPIDGGGGCVTTGLSLAAKVAALGAGIERTR